VLTASAARWARRTWRIKGVQDEDGSCTTAANSGLSALTLDRWSQLPMQINCLSVYRPSSGTAAGINRTTGGCYQLRLELCIDLSVTGQGAPKGLLSARSNCAVCLQAPMPDNDDRELCEKMLVIVELCALAYTLPHSLIE